VGTERKQVLDLIQEAAIYVKQNEKDTCRYETYASARPSMDGTDVICMVERYVSAHGSFAEHFTESSSRYKHKQALREHGESATFRKFRQDLSNQDLLLAPPSIHILSQRGGFSSRL
jgi:quinol monooxygenase YgiN